MKKYLRAELRYYITRFFHFFAFQDRWILGIFLMSLLVNGFLWVWLTVNILPTENPIPLHYSRYFGVDYLDFWYKVYMIPVFGLVVLGVNQFLISKLYFKERMLTYLLAGTTLTVHGFLLFGAYFVVWLNAF